jgi:hypothetical protein
MAQAIGRSTYSWPLSRLLPMLPNAGTEKFVSCLSSRHVLFAFVVTSIFLELVFPGGLSRLLVVVVEVRPPRRGQGTSPEEAIFNRNKAAAEKRHAARKAQHKKHQITKRDRNDNRIKRRKAGELGVSFDKDPSPEPSWNGDAASAVHPDAPSRRSTSRRSVALALTVRPPSRHSTSRRSVALALTVRPLSRRSTSRR